MADDTTPLDIAVDAYLNHLRVERNLADNSLKAYGRDLSDFVGFVIERQRTTPEGIEGADVVAWVQDLARADLARRSQSRMLVAVRGFYKWRVKTRQQQTDPTADVALPKLGKPLPKVPRPDDIIMLLQQVRTCPRDYALCALLYGAGLRVTESITLDVGDVHLDAAWVRVMGKGSKERVVPIGEPVVQAVQSYLDTDRPQRLKGRVNEALFPGRAGRGRFTRQAVFGMLRRASRNAGLAKPPSPHALRHAFATDLVRGGADLRSIQAMLGHADLRTTEVYTHVDDAHLRQVVDTHHPRG